jgi:hypothetical protein
MIHSSHVPIVRRSSSLRNKDPCGTAEGPYVEAEFVGKELQGDVATQLEVFRFMDHSHASGADLAEFCGNSDPRPAGGFNGLAVLLRNLGRRPGCGLVGMTGKRIHSIPQTTGKGH